jgi:isohexenylglutaconyl-CoA hydratase
MSQLSQTDTLLLERDEGWLTIWLNRPETRNALSSEMVEELLAVTDALQDMPEIRGVTFRGKGGVFCAGGDLKAFREFSESGMSHDEVAATSRRAGMLFHAVNELPQVSLMLVEGAAMAGGLGLVCAGDVVAVTLDTRFALTETMLGIPPAQIAPLIVQRVGVARARRLMLTAARFEGEEARRLGIADEVVGTGNDFAALEARIRAGVLQCAPEANAVTKELVLVSSYLSSEEMIERAGEEFATCLLGEEGREGVVSFLEKRKPSWAQ